MNVLIACEESQVVCKAFRAKGHNAFSCDIKSCSGGETRWHIKGDALQFLNPEFFELDLFYGHRFYTEDGVYHEFRGKWDLIIAHPPCTFITAAGARWMYPQKGVIDESRYYECKKAVAFFMAIWLCDCDRVVIENPRPLKIAALPKETQRIQPYMFDPYRAHPYSKLTYLWERGVQPLVPTTPNFMPVSTFCPSNTSKAAKGLGRGGVGAARRGNDGENRSKTFTGVAAAMADQWGGMIYENTN